MKKALLIILVFSLLLIPSAYAENKVYTPTLSSSYNLGDDITITGQITLRSSVSGAKVKFYVRSDDLDQDYEITTKFYSFSENVTTSFSQINKGLLTWKVPADIKSSNDWVIIVDVEGATGMIHRVRSDDFMITSRLSTIFGLNKNTFNLGENLEVSGTVLDARGNPAKGTATIKLIEGGADTVLSDSVEFQGGYLYYSYQFKSTDPLGEYTLEVEPYDSKGNFEEVEFANITVDNILPMECSVMPEETSPGGKVAITGKLRDIHREPIEGNEVRAYVTDPSLIKAVEHTSQSDSNGNFALDIELGEQSIPGEYKADLVAEDEFGNIGTCPVSFFVGVTKDAEANLFMNKTWFYPDEEMNLVLIVKNTGNVGLEGDLEIRVDGLKKLKKDFSAGAGRESETLAAWRVSGGLGEHSIQLRVIVDDETLTETMPEKFTIVERPTPPKPLNYLLIAGIIIVIFLGVVYLYSKRQNIKEYRWNRELKKDFKH